MMPLDAGLAGWSRRLEAPLDDSMLKRVLATEYGGGKGVPVRQRADECPAHIPDEGRLGDRMWRGARSTRLRYT
jgi:hypothetical protein